MELKEWNKGIDSPRGMVGFKGYDPHSSLISFVAVLPASKENGQHAVDYTFDITDGQWHTLDADWELQLAEFSRTQNAFVAWKPRLRVFLNEKQVLHGLTEKRHRVPSSIRLNHMRKGKPLTLRAMTQTTRSHSANFCI